MGHRNAIPEDKYRHAAFSKQAGEWLSQNFISEQRTQDHTIYLVQWQRIAYFHAMENAMLCSEDRIGKQTLEEFAQTERYNRWIMEILRPHIKGSRLLEVGCGLGNITRLLAETCRPTALDIRPEYVSRVEKELKVPALCGDLSQTALFQAEFDTVICLNVLEHIADQEQALANMRHALHPGGRLLLLVPAFQWLFGTVDQALSHHRRYTRRGLRRLVEGAGFNTLSSRYFNVFGIPGWFLHNRVLRRNELPLGQLRSFDRLVPLLRILDRPFRALAGISVVLIAENPA